MSKSFAGTAVIVTGGTRGIGKGIAAAFVSAGANVLITGRDANVGHRVIEALNHIGNGTCRFLQADVAHRDSANRMVEYALETLGGIQVLCANAGIYPSKSLNDMTEDDLDQVVGTNLKGNVFSVQACIPALAASGQGRIILTSSITGPITGFPGFTHYGASKAAQLGFMRTAAIELAGKGITVNAILPGTILTDGLEALGEEFVRESASSIPMKRLGTLEDVAHAALFFASTGASYITGQALVIDGGQVLPESPQALAFLD